eukprot:m.48874 g.48874  ORF g.48874 m.48874 type:complete len:77 (-) comp7420_c1_seq1:1199-1429(-)
MVQHHLCLFPSWPYSDLSASTISFNIFTNLYTSEKVLYIGTGAIRITFGSRISQITPLFSNSSNTGLMARENRIES